MKDEPETELTNDPPDGSGSYRDTDPETGLQKAYLVLSEEERAKGYVEPLRYSYTHEKCGTVTTMSQPIAETYARDPRFYGGTYCARCRDHFPVGHAGEFVWEGTDIKVGAPNHG